MRKPEFNPGDRVSHFREPGNVGKVVCVEKRGIWPCRYWAYWVNWGRSRVVVDDDGLSEVVPVGPVPLSRGLWHVYRTDAQQLGRGEVA